MTKKLNEKEMKMFEKIKEYCSVNEPDKEYLEGTFNENMIKKILDRGNNEKVWHHLFITYRLKNKLISKRRICAFFGYNVKNSWNLLSEFYTWELLERAKIGYLNMVNLDRWDLLFEHFEKRKGQKND